LCHTRLILQRQPRPRGRRSGVDIDPGSLRRAREQAGLSLAQVAGADLTRQAVHLIETGRARPSPRTLEIIARRLGRPASDFRVSGSWLAAGDARLAHLDELCQAHRYEEALRHASDLAAHGAGDRQKALGHFYAGQALHHLNRLEEAVVELLRAEELAGQLGDPWLAAEAMDWRGRSLLHRGDPEALPVAEKALARYRELQTRRPEIEARMLEHVGTSLVRRHDFEQALRYFQSALQLFATKAAVRDLEGMALVYHGLAGCAWAAGDLRRAVDLMQRVVALYAVENELRPLAARRSLPRAENDLAVLLLELGQLERAEDLLMSAHGRAIAAVLPGHDRAQILMTIGQLRQAQGRLDEAFGVVGEAVRLCEAVGEQRTLAEGYQQLGELHAARGEAEARDATFGRALAILDAAGLAERRERCRAAYERVLAAAGGAEVERPAS
jgi:tetratricopeptide (TPR) repeat protein